MNEKVFERAQDLLWLGLVGSQSQQIRAIAKKLLSEFLPFWKILKNLFHEKGF